jgi:integrase
MAIDKKAFSKTKQENIYIHENGIKFWFDFTLDGKRYSKIWTGNKAHTAKDRLKLAINALNKYKEELIHKNNVTADTEATLNDYYTYLKSTNTWNAKTTKSYDGIYNKYIRCVSINPDGSLTKEHSNSLGNTKIKDVTPPTLTRLNTTLTHLAKGSQKKIYDILIPLFKLAVEDEIIIQTPIKKNHVPKRDQLAEKKVIISAEMKYKKLYQTLQQLFNSNDIISFEDGSEYQCSINHHHLALFLFGFHGRRLNEVVTLRWEDIDLHTGHYRIRRDVSKIETDMIFALPTDIQKALINFQDTTGNIFQIQHPKKYYKHIRAISGLEEFSFHWMRNLAVSALSSMGVDVTHLSAMLGHTDAGTLKKYLSLQREASTKVTNNMSQKLLGIS